jgi:hypothetical protein
LEYKKYEEEFYELLIELTDQHLEIQKEIKKMKNDLLLNYDISTVHLRDLMNNHLKF